MSKNTALLNLKRQEYRKIISNPADSADAIKHGVLVVVARLAYLADPNDVNAVNIIIEQFKNEIEKLWNKGISKEQWPKFLQDENWEEKTYERFGVSYQVPEKLVKIAQDKPTTTKVSTEGNISQGKYQQRVLRK